MLIQQLSKETGVPIEPESSKALLDSIVDTLEYACYAAVPGAGGNDAIFVIGRGDVDLHERIQSDICSRFKNEEGKQISVLPVRVLSSDNPALILS